MASRRGSTSSTAIPVPYGLIRFGVAPDHQSLKAVSKRYDKVAESAGVDFIGNVTVGRDVSVAELLDLYDAVILATGAPHDRKLGIPGEDLPGVVGSAEFVGWYNGHPDFADLDPPLGGTHAAVDRQRQCRARLRAHPVEDAARVRRLGHRRPCARRARRLGDPHRHHPRPPRPAPDRDDSQGAWRARPSRSGGAGRRSRPISRRPKPTSRSSRACANRSACCAASPRPRSEQAQAHRLRLLRQAASRSKATARPSGSSSSAPCSTTRAPRAAPARPMRSPRR